MSPVMPPAYVQDGITMLGALLGPADGEDCLDPTRNSGPDAEFDNDVFEIRAFCWCDGAIHPDLNCPPNFKCGDYEVRWYKYLGRGMEQNREMTPEEWRRIMVQCLQSIGRR